ncbi:unnamed protein product (macronuclear) [Paramecium tetraurelia]|uniref:Transmembrane protein n=1 Tax=Paramecium tetraurelia TaxID=5888 RepID=A0DE52_PARTE|nr:uncharacterized protein GSPATT00016161001 [Paramecium tetraurelia]CAK81319.1 unnamed protein product [Paramecium tetraurelia]|eukprot:XP_001448716.1 hypothetical protein (macronuclear) [Paramecium tetraurelia strain d4-2]
MRLFLLVGCILSFGFSNLIKSGLGIIWEPNREAVIIQMKEMQIYYRQFPNYDVAMEKQRLINAYIQLLQEKQEEIVNAHQIKSFINYFEIQFLEIHNKYTENQIPDDMYRPPEWEFDYQYYLQFIYWPIGFVLGLFLINLIYYYVADNCLKKKTE